MRSLLALAVVLLLSGCIVQKPPGEESGGDAGDVAPGSQPPGEVAFIRVEQGQNSNIQGPDFRSEVLYANASWQDFWARHAAGRVPSEAPAVDFEGRLVAAAIDRQHGTTGYTLSIVRVEWTGAAYVVHYATESPGPDCVNGMAVTTPYDIVSLPRTEGSTPPVTFQFLGNTVRDCV